MRQPSDPSGRAAIPLAVADVSMLVLLVTALTLLLGAGKFSLHVIQ